MIRLSSLYGPILFGTTLLMLTAATVGCDRTPSDDPPQAPADEESSSTPTAPTAEDRLAAFGASTDAVAEAVAEGDSQTHQWWEDLLATAMDPTEPLPKVVRQALEDIEFDPHPESLTRDSHYWVSNEHHHYLFREAVDGHGGIYMGVGTDQNYLIGAWAQPAILILMDFDEQIRNVHHLYELMFSRADTPEEFIDLWSAQNADEMHTALKEKYGEGERFDALKRTFDIARAVIHARLRMTARAYERREIPSFVTDQDKYDFIRSLWENDRVFPVRGDLTADTTMVDIATTLDELGLSMGIIYTSNAEQYFDFTPAYRRNIAVQPFDDESLMLRTRPASAFGFPEGGEYHYNVQPGLNFADWMQNNTILNSWRLLSRHREDADTQGLSYIREAPEPSDNPPQLAELPDE